MQITVIKPHIEMLSTPEALQAQLEIVERAAILPCVFGDLIECEDNNA